MSSSFPFLALPKVNFKFSPDFSDRKGVSFHRVSQILHEEVNSKNGPFAPGEPGYPSRSQRGARGPYRGACREAQVFLGRKLGRRRGGYSHAGGQRLHEERRRGNRTYR